MHPRPHPVPHRSPNGSLNYVCPRCRWPWYLCGCIGGCAAPVAPPAMIQKIPGCNRWIIGNPPTQHGPVSPPPPPPPPPPRIAADLEDADREELQPMVKRHHLVSLPCWGCGAPISSGACCDALVAE